MNTVLPARADSDVVIRDTPDATLLQRWAGRQHESDFAELVRRHLGLVRGVACRQLGEDHADDTAQAVFAILVRKAPALRAVRSLSAWLHRVTLLQCRSAVRRLQRERRTKLAAMENAALNAARDPLENALPLLDAGLAALGDADRELLLLRYSEGLSFAEASNRTGRSEAALRQQAGRALEKLSAQLRRRGVTVPATALASGLGTVLSGPGAAEAAVLCTRTALAAAQKLSTGALAALTFSTMNTTQSILAGAAAALLLAGGPVAWRIHQVNEAQAVRATAATPPVPAKTDPAETPAVPSPEPAPSPTTANATASTETDIEKIFEELLNSELRASMGEWARRSAWLEARRMGRLLPLVPSQERELRAFIEATLNQRVERDLRDEDEAAGQSRRDYEKSLEEWYAANLTPEQNQRRLEAVKARREALVEMLAEDALHGISAAVSLTEEQKTRLYDAAAAKVNQQLEDDDYGGRMQFGAGVSKPPAPSLEESAGDLLATVLDPAQMELWEQTRAQERMFSEILPRRLADRSLSVIREQGLLSTLIPMLRGILGNP